MSRALGISLPAPLRHFFSLFPLYTHPEIESPDKARPLTSPTLWIHVPWSPDADVLSSDVECLKWQAYLALRGLSDIAVRWDIAVDGALDARLPNLHVLLKTLPGASDEVKAQDDGEGELLPAHLIPEWVDGQVGALDELEGYVDEAARDESRAWVALLEGNVHAALVLNQPSPSSLLSLLSPYQHKARPLEAVLPHPPAPLFGISSLLPPYGTHVDVDAIELQYRDAIASLSERLGTDKWFLGSSSPTALDALVFAYLHCILHSKDHTLRFEVTRRVNLVAWERRVQSQVRSGFRLVPVLPSS
ncbi:hypothetical protein L226DRAFT_479461 [Lentinus tigrinus ALCF2SS1-7]|uniref:Metaxin glutathione S-transferase domain-containing protein n=1 Tax=Lentinus tigrinus ALCF2SS1-6 TaxID=1328759 RepID=A0A5C2STL3_9APHY|nr:hypothetical protein L227DRAFT_570502 [Lentinus tigrinus ALCF2SS1-6]RPD80582.1 hypothetical protein L226DRAFT_479461 [Lentinus tigrinus ALCF2SS1-7]